MTWALAVASQLLSIILLFTLILLPQPATMQALDKDARLDRQLYQGENVKMISQIGGLFHAVDIQDGYAYVGEGRVLVVIDVHNPNAPLAIARTASFENEISSITADGDRLYLTDSLNLWILDISSPVDPQILGTYPALAGIYSPYPVGNILYVTSGEGLLSLDVSNPQQPQLLDSLDPGIPIPNRLLGVHALDDVLYAGGGWTGLYTFDISNPSDLKLLGNQGGFGDVIEVKAHAEGNKVQVFMAAGSQITIADATNPANLTFIGKLFTIEYSEDIEVVDDIAYVADGHGGLWVVDVSTPSTPFELARLDLPSIAADIDVEGSTAYLANYSAGMRIIDISITDQPKEIASYEVPAWTGNVIANGETAYLGAEDLGISILNIHNPQSPFQVSRFDTPGSVEDLQVISDMLFVADLDGGLGILDISNPTKPEGISSITPSVTLPITLTQDSIGVHVVGNYAYLANQAGGLWIVDISDPTQPHDLGLYSTPDWYWTTDIYVNGNIAYVANSEAGLRVVDVSDPNAPNEISFLDFVDTVQAVVVRDSLAYVANGYGGLRIVDILDPSHPAEIGNVDTPGWATELFLDENLAYVADYGEGVRVIDVSDPQNPVEVGHYLTPGGATSVFQQGCQTYTSLWGSGMMVLSYTGPEVRCQVSGKVTDRYNTPLSGIEISAGNGFTGTTDEKGIFQITDLPGASYTVTLNSNQMSSFPAIRVLDIPPDWVDQNFIVEVAIEGLQATSNSPSLLGTPTTFIATLTAGTNVTFSWDLGDNSPIVTGEVVTHTYSVEGEYTVHVIADNVVSQAEANTQIWVTENTYSVQLPLILFSTE